MGRPRTRGDRLPTPAALATARTARGTWHRLRLVLYGKTVTPLVFQGTALWYSALREAPIRFVVVRDPRGRRRDEAFFCTDPTATASVILTAYARRWTLEMPWPQCPHRDRDGRSRAASWAVSPSSILSGGQAWRGVGRGRRDDVLHPWAALVVAERSPVALA